MDEIAQDIGLGKASIYYYYPAKQDVIRGVVEREMRQFADELERSLAVPEPASARLRLFAEKRILFFRQLGTLGSLGEWAAWRPLFRDLFADLAATEERVLLPILREGQHAGEFDIPSPERVARLIVHLLQGLRLRLLKEHQEPDEPLRDELERDSLMCIDLLLSGIVRKA